jgi:hypothetical protein
VATAEDIQALNGEEVSIRLVPAAGGATIEGRVVGTLDAADGLVVVVAPKDAPEQRFTCNYQHIDTIERR